MSSKRMVSGKLFEDEFFCGLTIIERLLWIGLISGMADDQGRFLDKPILIKSRLFLYDDQIDEVLIEKAMRHLEEGGIIVRYAAGDKKLVQIKDWWQHQAPSWASPSMFPAPDGWTDRYKSTRRIRKNS